MTDARVESWRQLARDAVSAATVCRSASRARSAVSRAYYALYSAATAWLIDAGEAPPVRGNWPHRELPTVVTLVLRRRKTSENRRRDIVRNLRVCYSMRLDADYQPGRTVDDSVAGEAVRSALSAMRLLGAR